MFKLFNPASSSCSCPTITMISYSTSVLADSTYAVSAVGQLTGLNFRS